MARCRLLFVGTKPNMEVIFENCPDSSSESCAEMAFSCDWIDDDIWYNEEFTKQDEHYQDVINGKWVYCYDIRDVNHFADYACLNKLGHFDYNQDEEYKTKVIEHIKTLPDDTTFFFQVGHF